MNGSLFGKTTVISGNAAVENPMRFSTKYYDDETKLYYYGYRYYAPGLGRWICRDLIEEQGGINVLVCSNNDLANKIDILGLMIRRNDVPSIVISPPPDTPPLQPPSPPVTSDCVCPPGSNKGTRPDPAYTRPEPNGCGPGYFPIKLDDPMKFTPPFFRSCSFRGPCNYHDNCYATCNSDKGTSDAEFHSAMREACYECSNHIENLITKYLWRAACYETAATYLFFVSQPVGNPYEKSQEDACEDCRCCP